MTVFDKMTEESKMTPLDGEQSAEDLILVLTYTSRLIMTTAKLSGRAAGSHLIAFAL